LSRCKVQQNALMRLVIEVNMRNSLYPHFRWRKLVLFIPLIPIIKNRDDISSIIYTRYIFIILFVLYPNRIINKVINPNRLVKRSNKSVIIIFFSFKQVIIENYLWGIKWILNSLCYSIYSKAIFFIHSHVIRVNKM
jgi:hypothetical protein